MSTSPSRAPLPPPGNAKPLVASQPFPYDSISPDLHHAGTLAAGGVRAWGAGGNPSEALSREAAARAQGRDEGLAASRQAFEEQLARERSSLAAALAEFTSDRAAYFQQVEAEIVQLALAIARKILHREAQLDPLLLAGIVRVALEKIDHATGVVLRLHPTHAADWRRYLSTHLSPADLPEIVEDPSQDPDRCTLETAMGTAVLGLDVQLKEIEQGLMDLLAARPGARP